MTSNRSGGAAMPKVGHKSRESFESKKIRSNVSLPTLQSSVTVKQNIKLVCSWFKKWRSWQRRIVLCNAVLLCSKDLLYILLTSLEPLLHRDFSAFIAPQDALLKQRSPTHESLKKYKAVDTSPQHSVESSTDLSTGQPDDSVIASPPAPFLPPIHGITHQTSIGSRNPTSEDFFSFKRKHFGSSLTIEHSSCLLKKKHGSRQHVHQRAKSWTGASSAVKPKVVHLIEQFRDQQMKICKWLESWEDHQRIWLLLDVIKLCSVDQLGYLAQCIQQRLKESCGVDVLSDCLLLNVFSYLDARSLLRASQVSRHWHRLCSTEVLWKAHCSNLGLSEGMGGLTGALEALGQGRWVDWKQAFKQLKTIVKRIKNIVIKSAAPVESEEGEEEEEAAPLTSALIRQRYSLREMIQFVQSGSSIALTTQGVLKFAPESAAEKRRRLRSERLQRVISAEAKEMEEEKERDAAEMGEESLSSVVPQLGHYGEPKIPLQMVGAARHSPLRGGIHVDWKKETDTGKDGESVSRKRKEVDLLPVAIDMRPAVPFMPDPRGIEALILAGKLLDGDLVRPGRVQPIPVARRLVVHEADILCTMFDLRKVITGSADMTVRIHDMRSGREINILEGHKGGVRCLQYDDTRLITGSWDTSCIVWDLVKYSVLAVLIGHTDSVTSLCFNQQFILTGSDDHTLRVWHSSLYHCMHELTGHKGSISCALLTNRTGYSGSRDKTVKVWDVETGKCTSTLNHNTPVIALEVSNLLLLTATVGGMLHAWDLSKNVLLMEWSIHNQGVPLHAEVTALCLNKTLLIAGASDGCIYEWDIGTATCNRFLRGHSRPVTSVKFNHGRLVSVSADMSICIWYSRQALKDDGISFDPSYFADLPLKVITV